MLRTDLAWKNMRKRLSRKGSGVRALDLGGGTGLMSLRLAKLDFHVVLLDRSEAMLALAEKGADKEGLASRISFHHADAGRLRKSFEDHSFDVIVCHNVLEYAKDPEALVSDV